MTREEVITELEKGRPKNWDLHRDIKAFDEAVDMAVKALKVNEVHIVIIRDVDGNPQINCCFDNIKSTTEYIDYLHSQGITWIELLSMDLYSDVQDVMEE